MSEIRKLMEIFASRRFSLLDEKRLQAELEEALTDAGIEFRREHRLDAGSIVDFMVGDIGVEVKIKGSKLAIFRQIERYARFDVVKQILLVTNVPMGLPNKIKGKPAFIVNLAKAWL